MTTINDTLKLFNFTAATSSGINIKLGNGNNTIGVVASNANITAGNGNNSVITSGDNESILLGDGDNNVLTNGNSNKVTVGDGDNKVIAKGNTNTIKAGDGDNKVIVNGNTNSVTVGDGDNIIGSKGNDNTIKAGDGDNVILFWGDNATINVGDGDNNIKTLDWVNGGLQAKTDEAKTYLDSLNLKSKHTFKALEDSDIKDLASGISSSVSRNTSTTSKQIGSYQTKVRDPHRCHWYVTNWGTFQDTTTTTTSVSGVNNPNITTGSGKNDILISATSLNKNISTSSRSVVTAITGGSTSTTDDAYDKPTGYWEYDSPLIVDYNQDGKVSAKAGTGIDINNDGKVDGAASDGDKMLAMSDTNNNGTIDGTEVFGNNTVDPFTGKKLNAENGFDALAKVAESAEKHTGISCMDSDGNVDLAKLKTALNTVGIDLGFVSDANNTMLEELDKVASINTKSYTNTKDDNYIKHLQQGYYTGTDGKKYKTDDVWFAV